ncbi:hypothetical protein [Flavobacterium sp.]|uniref:hypothetical protein n=1 Tax=Flavobacterium sp. TaxID=239 RepID=UPI002636458A|nr:hypothetical protein [Flavobacterium sp.]
MDTKKYRPVFEVLFAAFIAYGIHKLVFLFNADHPKFSGFYYSLETLYAFFTCCSLSILFILLTVKSKSIDYVGYTFLLVTVAKMVLSYIFLWPVLHLANANGASEKINFFIVFALFLTIETTVTIRILNNKQ